MMVPAALIPTPIGQIVDFLISQAANLEHSSTLGFAQQSLAIYFRGVRTAIHFVTATQTLWQ